MSRERALVTGASGGIGLEFAHVLAEKGCDLILTARRQDELHRLADDLNARHGIDARVVPADLARPGAATALYDEITAAGLQVDILINNAGFATFGRFAQIDLATERDLLNVNIIALTELTKLFLRGMLARRKGRILNVASTAAFQPGPLMAVYYASKAYVLHFSEAIAHELRDSGVTVTALCPGLTATGFVDRAALNKSKLAAGKLLDAAGVARAGYEAMLRGRMIVIPGFRHAAVAWGVRLMPRWLALHAVRRAQQPVTPS